MVRRYAHFLQWSPSADPMLGHYRCLQRGVGSQLPGIIHRGAMDIRGTSPPYNFFRDEGSLLRLEVFLHQQTIDFGVAMPRQYYSNHISQQDGWTSLNYLVRFSFSGVRLAYPEEHPYPCMHSTSQV